MLKKKKIYFKLDIFYWYIRYWWGVFKFHRIWPTKL